MSDLEFQTIPDLLQLSAKQFAERDAICDGDTTLTFADLGKQVQQSTRAMMAAGVPARPT